MASTFPSLLTRKHTKRGSLAIDSYYDLEHGTDKLGTLGLHVPTPQIKAAYDPQGSRRNLITDGQVQRTDEFEMSYNK